MQCFVATTGKNPCSFQVNKTDPVPESMDGACIAAKIRLTNRSINFQFDCGEHMSPFAEWIGKPVILQVRVDDSRSTLEGTIVRDAVNSLHFQLCKGRRTLMIAKSTILAVEQAPGLEARHFQRHWEMPIAS
jgi:hypothetical protein